jgi:hypothetical protein
MPRRVNLPAADDLFRSTDAPAKDSGAGKRAVRAVPDPAPESLAKKPSGRIRHDEKVTVYVTSQELLDIEHARLALRSQHGLVIDRGRLLREAISLVLADVEENGENSALVRRLNEA